MHWGMWSFLGWCPAQGHHEGISHELSVCSLCCSSPMVCILMIYLFALGFSEAGRPAALEPRLRGADHDHRVSGWRPLLRVLYRRHPCLMQGPRLQAPGPGFSQGHSPGGACILPYSVVLVCAFLWRDSPAFFFPHSSSWASHVCLSPQRESRIPYFRR